MTDLATFLFPAPAPRTAGGILRWWEARRLPYNLIVGGAGLVTLGVVGVATLILPGDPGFPPIGPVVAFGVLANLFYLLGPAVEIAAHKLWGRTLLPVGPALFRMGLTFSVGLALFPSLLVALFVVIRLVMWIF
jgi:hypothetical protein